MTRMFGVLLRGVGVGAAVGATVGVLTTAALTVTGWPSADPDPASRARHLGESISQGMRAALIATVVLIPASAAFFLRRARRPRSPRA